jgi:hypothetical protein
LWRNFLLQLQADEVEDFFTEFEAQGFTDDGMKSKA